MRRKLEARMLFSVIARWSMSIAMVCLPSTSAFCEMLFPHSLACYDRADLAFLVKYWRPMFFLARKDCFMTQQESEVTELRRLDVDLPVRELLLVQPTDGGRAFWVTRQSVSVLDPGDLLR